MAKSVSLKSFKAISNDALKSEELPSRIKVLNWGVNKSLDGEILLDDETVKVFYANQKNIGRTLCPLDFNHNTVPGTEAYKSDKEPRAIAGYGVPTIIPNDGMYWEYMQWTPSGIKSARDFADLSPTVLTDESNRVIGVHSCALTPAGAIDGLSFYSADSMPTLMSMVSLKAHEANPKPYGDVEYADAKNGKYPINTEEHVRAAWSYINMPKNHKGYTSEEISQIKKRIAAKAKHYGIELRAESADSFRHFDVGANAYVQDPYKGIDNMLDEHVDYFRKALGLGDDAEPDDVMKKLRAKFEGLEADKQPLPTKASGSSVDPQERGHGNLAEEEEPEAKKLVIAYTADLEKRLSTLIESKVTPLSASLQTLQTERDANLQRAEKAERDNLVAEASRSGKVIPLTAEEIATLPVATLKNMVAKLKPEVNITSHTATLKPLSADGKVIPGSRQRSTEAATEMFAAAGIVASGPKALGKPSQ